MTTPAGQNWAERLMAAGQPDLAAHWRSLSGERRQALERELAATDLTLLAELVADLHRPPPPTEAMAIEPVPVTRKGADPAADARARTAGEARLRAGQVAALVVAGGQGSRLGHAGPKGTFAATVVRRKPLFQVFAEKIKALSTRFGAPVRFLVMTSEENHADTVEFFRRHRSFGLDPAQVRFFTQGMLPAVDESGRVVVKAPGELFRSPNGHGGTLLALRDSGALDELALAGILDIFYFQVDNPIVEICDPVFLGYHQLTGSEFSSKVVTKSGPDEKVGVLARQNGRLCVVEYSDLPAELRNLRHPDGSLVHAAGNIAIHILAVPFVQRITQRGFRLPFHLARKKLPVLQADGTTGEVAGIKFETFIFDALAEARHPFALEIAREDEFAPIKNATGVDSAESSAQLQSALHARWLLGCGVTVPLDPRGIPLVPVEIAPGFASCADDLRRRKLPPIDVTRPIYLGEE